MPRSKLVQFHPGRLLRRGVRGGAPAAEDFATAAATVRTNDRLYLRRLLLAVARPPGRGQGPETCAPQPLANRSCSAWEWSTFAGRSHCIPLTGRNILTESFGGSSYRMLPANTDPEFALSLPVAGHGMCVRGFNRSRLRDTAGVVAGEGESWQRLDGWTREGEQWPNTPSSHRTPKHRAQPR